MTPKYISAPIKWPGGKFRELKHLIPIIPTDIETFVDPFLGGASLPINVQAKRFLVNDIDRDLISFYKIQGADQTKFLRLLEGVAKARHTALQSIPITPENFQEMFRTACVNCLRHISPELRRMDTITQIISDEMKRRQTKIDGILASGKIPVPTYAMTGMFAVIYYIVRKAFNWNREGKDAHPDPVVRVAMWYILRELSHGGMMRYSKSGDFNIPYGGLSYNRKDIMRKASNIQFVWDFFEKKNTQFMNGDFMTCLEDSNLTPDDFVFLDPPYDTAFSSYSTGGSFSRYPDIFEWMDHTPARFLMVTKQTDFITELLRKSQGHQTGRFHTRTFLKQYQVNIKNRNQRSATHLIIANYDLNRVSNP